MERAPGEPYGVEFLVGDFYLEWVLSLVQYRFDAKSPMSARVCDQVDDDVVTDLRSVSPVIARAWLHANRLSRQIL